MKYKDIDTAMRQMLGATQVLRKLGFTPDDIYASLGHGNVGMVVLKTQGKQFAIACGRTKVTAGNFDKTWAEVVTAWNGPMSDVDRQRIYEESNAYRNRIHLLMTLQQKGIKYVNREAEKLLN